MKNDFIIAITQLAAEKNLPKEIVLEAVELALASAFKKEGQGAGLNVAVKVNAGTGDMNVYAQKTVVEEVADELTELTVDEAHTYDPLVELGDIVSIEIPVPPTAGRIAAQTAKQVVMQRLREAEREVVFTEFVGKEGDIVSGIIHRVEPKQIIMDLGKTEAVLPLTEQVKTEHYRIGQRLKVYMMEVFRSGKGPQVVVSRTHRNLVRRLFELEVPEIFNGTVEIKAIAREPGYRSKVAVAARQEGVDAIGACVGLRGIRIQNIINELHGEKIDVVEWYADASVYVAHALSPAPVLSVSINEDEKTATVVVPDRQLSLAIGKEGQNARLAAKLTGWRIDIKSASLAEAEHLVEPPVAEQEQEEPLPQAARAETALEEVVVAEVTDLAPAAVEEVAAVGEQQAPAASVVVEAPVVETTDRASEPDRSEGPTEVLDASIAGAPEEAPVAANAPGRIRFAEEIFPESRGAAKKTRGKKERTVDEAAAATAAKPKKARRGPRTYEETEPEEELENIAGPVHLPTR